MIHKTLLTILLLVIVNICNSQDPIDKRDFVQARNVGTTEAYERYLEKHPNGFYAEIVREQIGKTAVRQDESEKLEKKLKNRNAFVNTIFAPNESVEDFLLQIESAGGLDYLGLQMGDSYGYAGLKYGVFLSNDQYLENCKGAGGSVYINARKSGGFYLGLNINYGFSGQINEEYYNAHSNDSDWDYVGSEFLRVGPMMGYHRYLFYETVYINVFYEYCNMHYKSRPRISSSWGGLDIKDKFFQFGFSIGIIPSNF